MMLLFKYKLLIRKNVLFIRTGGEICYFKLSETPSQHNAHIITHNEKN